MEPNEKTMTSSKTWAERVKRCRRYTGLTIHQFATLLRVTHSTVWLWEKGLAQPIQANIAAVEREEKRLNIYESNE